MEQILKMTVKGHDERFFRVKNNKWIKTHVFYEVTKILPTENLFFLGYKEASEADFSMGRLELKKFNPLINARIKSRKRYL